MEAMGPIPAQFRVRKEGQNMQQEAKIDNNEIIEIQQKALDDIVSVNSLFTMAVFIGLAFASPGQKSLQSTDCDADPGVAKRLIVYEVVSFALFLLSSLTAKTLKVQLHIYRFNQHSSPIKYVVFRVGMLFVSFAGSLTGVLFLTLSIVNLIQIRLGKLSCRGVEAMQAVGWLCGIVLAALAIYLPSSVNVILFLIAHRPPKQKTDDDQASSKV